MARMEHTMTQVNVLDAKNNLSKLLRMLEAGDEERIIIARNGSPVAQLTLVDDSSLRRVGVTNGKKLMADDYDLDDDDLMVAEMFGAM